MSVELRYVKTGTCDHGPKRIGEPRMSCEHRVESDWGLIEHPEARPDRGEVGHLLLVTRPYFECLLTGEGGCRRYIERGFDPDGRVRWQEFTATTRGDRRFLSTAWPVFSHGQGITQEDGSELPPERTQCWTWELFEAHWADVESQPVTPLFIGRWPD
jgi:hypothetical protein